MRANEYIRANQSSIKYIEDVKNVIAELLPYRGNKQITDDYFNRILSADIRKQNYLMQKDFFERNNAMQQEEPQLEVFENEIPFERAADVRESLFQVVRQDKSFGYLYFLLGTEQNSKHKSEPIDCIPNPESINQAIKQYRDDYPKNSLSEYLNDNFNYSQYEKITENNDFEEATLLEFFNNAYRIYDELRIAKENPLVIATYYISDNSHNSELLKFYTYSFIDSLITEYAQGDEQLLRVQKELRKLLKPLLSEFEESSTEKHSNIPSKIKYIIITELLKQIGKGKANNDLTAICRLVSLLTNTSEKSLYVEAQKGISLTSYHKNDIEKANEILSALNLGFTIKKDTEY